METMEEIKESTPVIKDKPRLSGRAIWNMSMGFLGIQAGFALQNGNASRILQTFGANVDSLPLFWLAAPLTGLIVQPIIGHYSDQTWNKLGRRKPYFLVGALLTAFALVFLPNAGSIVNILSPLWMGAGLLTIMCTSINIAMEPFRALVADKLPNSQRSAGFATQTFLIGIGAMVGSWLPYFLAEYTSVPKTAPQGVVPQNVCLSFYIGAAMLVVTILWTIFTTREDPPASFDKGEKQAATKKKQGLGVIWSDLWHMPKTMKELGWVQFFSWFALFSMWVFTTPAIAEHIYHVNPGDTSSERYADASNWVGILFGIYNAVSAVYALVLPRLARHIGRKGTHIISLLAGGIGLASIYFISSPTLLILPMIGVGIAWGSILSMPYAILSSALPPQKMGVYMGIFNFFITLPQVLNGLLGGLIVKYLLGDNSILVIVLAGVFLIIAALATIRVQDNDEERIRKGQTELS